MIADPALLLAIALVALAAFAAVLASYRWPERALAASFFLILVAGTKFRERDPFATIAGEIDLQILFELGLYALVGTILVVTIASVRPRTTFPSLALTALIAYVTLAMLSTAWSAIPGVTLVRGAQLAVLLAFGVAAVHVLGVGGSLGALSACVVAYVLIAGLAGLLQAVIGGSWAGQDTVQFASEGFRFSWFAVDPNNAGTLAGIAATLVLAGLVFRDPRPGRRAAWRLGLVTLVPLVAILVATRSRGAIAAFAIAGVVVVLRRWSRPWSAGLALVVCLGVSVGLASLAFREPLIEFLAWTVAADDPVVAFLVRGNGLQYLTTLGGRTELWLVVTMLFEEQPVLGYGFMASRKVLLELFPWAGYAHNAFAQTLLDLGLVGAVLLWFAVFRALLTDLLKPRWARVPNGEGRGIIFGTLIYMVVLSFVAGSFTEAPGLTTLLVFVCVVGSERCRIPAFSRAGQVVRRPVRRARVRPSPIAAS